MAAVSRIAASEGTKSYASANAARAWLNNVVAVISRDGAGAFATLSIAVCVEIEATIRIFPASNTNVPLILITPNMQQPQPFVVDLAHKAQDDPMLARLIFTIS